MIFANNAKNIITPIVLLFKISIIYIQYFIYFPGLNLFLLQRYDFFFIPPKGNPYFKIGNPYFT